MRTTGDGRVIAAGDVRPHELAQIGMDFPEGDYETIAGLVMDRLGRLARRGDEVEADGWRVRVTRVDGRRVGEVEIVPIPGEP